MGNKKYLIFIAIIIFSAFLFSNKAKAAVCESAEIDGTCQSAPCVAPTVIITGAACLDTTKVCCATPPAVPIACTSFSTSTDTASCKLISLCVPTSKQRQASDCGDSLRNVCCVEPKTSPLTGLCSGVGGTCKLDCLSTEDPKSGTFSDCIGVNTKCCAPKALCTASSGTCKPTCLATEDPKSGTFSDCTGANTTCCAPKGVAPPPVTAITIFPNPINCTTAQCLLIGLLKTLQGVVAIIAIIMIVIGGIMYMFAGVNEKSVELGKKMIGGAVIGLAIVVAAPAFLKELLAVLGGSGVDETGLLASAPSLKTIAERILNLVLSIAGILGIIGLIIGGGYYMTAYGDEDRIKKGKMVIGASLIGILFALAALVIVKQIAVLLGQ